MIRHCTSSRLSYSCSLSRTSEAAIWGARSTDRPAALTMQAKYPFRDGIAPAAWIEISLSPAGKGACDGRVRDEDGTGSNPSLPVWLCHGSRGRDQRRREEVATRGGDSRTSLRESLFRSSEEARCSEVIGHVAVAAVKSPSLSAPPLRARVDDGRLRRKKTLSSSSSSFRDKSSSSSSASRWRAAAVTSAPRDRKWRSSRRETADRERPEMDEK